MTAEITGSSIDEKFKQLESGGSLDDELAKMKRQLSGGSSQVLPNRYFIPDPVLFPDPPLPSLLPLQPTHCDVLHTLFAPIFLSNLQALPPAPKTAEDSELERMREQLKKAEGRVSP